MKRWLGLGALLALGGLSSVSAASCTNIVGGVGSPPPNTTPMPNSMSSGKLDLLLVVDDSASMGDKQAYLAQALPTLLAPLVSPPCIDGAGVFVSQPLDPAATCPLQSARASQPVTSIHLGVITSSLGGVGSDACPDTPGSFHDARGHLVVRTNPDPTYLGYGFLAFDPYGMLSPPGESDLGTFVQDAQKLVTSVGEHGCGYEMPLEAAYRFLVDPDPYDSLVKSGGGGYPVTTPSGFDDELLQERGRFLRADSVVAVILLTDENDCSVKAGGQWYAPLDSTPFFRAASVCGSNPGSSCCYSCGEMPPDMCAPDSICSTMPVYSAAEDNVNLKCFHQKERYGVFSLYPVTRYVNAFSKASIVASNDDLTGDGTSSNNPLFENGRSASSVIVTAIVGVPWQEIANDRNDPSKGMQNASALVANGTWDRIAGDPDGFVYPKAPVMLESVAKRPGVDPGENGGDRSLDTSAPGDLQYACTFKLTKPEPGSQTCTIPDSPDNPVCSMGVQIAGKAYPGLRELAVVGGLGDRGVVASICPFDPSDGTSPGSGYTPAMAATVQRLAKALAPR
jgi:hypothetical protein